MRESMPTRKRALESPEPSWSVTNSQNRPRTMACSTTSFARELWAATEATSKTINHRANASRPTRRIACGIDATERTPKEAELTILSNASEAKAENPADLREASGPPDEGPILVRWGRAAGLGGPRRKHRPDGKKPRQRGENAESDRGEQRKTEPKGAREPQHRCGERERGDDERDSRTVEALKEPHRHQNDRLGGVVRGLGTDGRAAFRATAGRAESDEVVAAGKTKAIRVSDLRFHGELVVRNTLQRRFTTEFAENTQKDADAGSRQRHSRLESTEPRRKEVSKQT